MTFHGRGFRKPTILRTATADGVTFRADCDANPESWGELTLTEADLLDALALVRSCRGRARLCIVCDAMTARGRHCDRCSAESVEAAHAATGGDEIEGVPGTVLAAEVVAAGRAGG